MMETLGEDHTAAVFGGSLDIIIEEHSLPKCKSDPPQNTSIWERHTESHACQLAVQLWNDLAYSLSCTWMG